MSAIVCGKRSSIFEEIPSPSSSSSPVSKRIRCSSFSPPRHNSSSPSVFVLDYISAIFPHMDKKLIEQALENSGNDLDLAIQSLNELRLGCADQSISLGMPGTFPVAHQQLSDQAPVYTDKEIGSGKDPTTLPIDGAEWVEFFVTEMSSASDVNDAKLRASRALEVFQKSVRARTCSESGQDLQQENLMLKEQVQALLQENGILKRAVSIQHERQKEYEAKSQEVQQLKQLLSQCQEHIRTLEVNNYALSMHLKQAQQNNTIPGRFNPDVF